MKKDSASESATSGNVGCEAQLWLMPAIAAISHTAPLARRLGASPATATLREQQAEAAKLDAAIAANLKELGYGG